MKKLEYYKKALLIATTEQQEDLCGLCHFLLAAQFELDYGKTYDEMSHLSQNGSDFDYLWKQMIASTHLGKGSFPELFKYKPRERNLFNSAHWFPYDDRETRIKILQSIIKELE